MGWWYDDEGYDDNHTLADYHTPPDALVIKGRVIATSQRGTIGTEWWGKQWVTTIERLGLGGRIERGRRYARNGSVHDLEISYGMAYAQVSGSRLYRTAIHLRILKDEEWERALAALSQQAIYSAKLLAGEMPGDIEAIFQEAGVSLFPQSVKDITFECSCPDYGDPCKHAAAVYYLVAEQLDTDPFILFHLRGRKREQVLATLRQYRGGEGHMPDHSTSLAHEIDRFWQGFEHRPMTALPSIPSEAVALRELGPPPNGLDLQPLYQSIAAAAYQQLIGDNFAQNGESE